jgi:MFS family permease
LNFGFLTEDIKIPLRRLLAVVFLFSSTFAWFYIFHIYLLDKTFASLGPTQWLYLGKALFYTSIVFSAIIGSLISERVNRRKLLWSWIAFGVLTTASLAVFQGLVFSLLSSALLGASFGLGFPSCLAFLADSTAIEERARVSGVLFFLTLAMVFLLLLFSSLLNLGVVELVWLALILRASSFFALLIDPCARETGKEKSWLTILASKDFVLYLFPWLIFNIANGLTSFVRVPESASAIGQVLMFGSACIVALTSGVLADRFGRKWPIIIGQIMLGASYAFLGLATSSLSWLVYMTTQGIAWGFIAVSYFLAVLGDLSSPGGSKERFYVLGGIIPLVMIMSFSGVSDLLNLSAPAGALYPALSILLFVSFIPVLRASETLPETKARARRMREYVKKVGKLVQESKKPE